MLAKKKKKKSQTGRTGAGAFLYTLQDLGGFQKLHAGRSFPKATENSVLADGLYLNPITEKKKKSEEKLCFFKKKYPPTQNKAVVYILRISWILDDYE